MTLNHSKTWPVSTLAVVQLRVDPNGRTYSTQLDVDLQDAERPSRVGDEVEQEAVMDASKGVVLPLSHEHVELFTRTHLPHPYKRTVRTDTVSTILDHDIDTEIEQTGSVNEDELPSRSRLDKFHVLALARIDESLNEPEYRGRRASVKVDNWDLIYTERDVGRTKLCPACSSRCNEAAMPQYANKTTKSPIDYNDRLLPDLPLDARKVTTLRRHYYPEGGWGWVIIAATVLVHVLNVGLQLSCSQLVAPAAEKFKTLPVHIAVRCVESWRWSLKKMEDAPKAERIIRITVVGDGYTGKTCLLIVYKDKKYNEKYIPTVFDSYSMTIPISGDNYKIILSDTAGQEDYDKLRPLAYNETDVFIICYSVDNKDSYDNVHLKWNKEIRHYKPAAKVILVATKIDLREVDRTRNKYLNFGHGEKLKRMINADDFVECSSKLMFNVNKVFEISLLSLIKSPVRKQSRACTVL